MDVPGSSPSSPIAGAAAATPRGSVRETPTEVGSCSSISSLEDGGEAGADADELGSLGDRIPSTERVLRHLVTLPEVKTLLDTSYIYSEEGARKALLSVGIWSKVSKKIVKAISTCAATVEKEAKKMMRKYMFESFEVDVFAAGLFRSEEFPASISSDATARRHTSILLQILCMEYISAFHELISYPSKGVHFSIPELVAKGVAHAASADTNALFPRSEVQANVYYIIGFLGTQAEKHAKRRTKDSGIQKCLTKFSKERFFVRNRGQESQVDVLIQDEELPTSMVQRRERLGGLQYPDKSCWQFFAKIEYLYATLATAENFICRGGMLLREISDSILANDDLISEFSTLCGLSYSDDAQFTLADVTMSFHFFLRVFGRVRAKDIALKYNSAIFKGKNTVALRAGLAAHTGGKGKGRKRKASKQEGTASEERTGTASGEEEAHHKELVEDLDNFDREVTEDMNTKKIPSEAAVEKFDDDA